MKKCGVYCIENTVNNKKYIGSSKRIDNRFRQHKEELKNGEHCNGHLINSFKKYGIDVFKFYIIEECEEEKLLEQEDYWMEFLHTMNNTFGYNCFSASRPKLMSEETRKKLSLAKLGEKHFMYGKHVSEEVKLKMRMTQLGVPRSEETKAKMRKPKSKEHADKIRISVLGRKHSKETIRKRLETKKNNRIKRELLKNKELMCVEPIGIVYEESDWT
jgi:group I intron endonuclease